MKKNKLRELLNAGKPSLGTHMISTSPQIVEVIGHSGVFDYIELCGLYASWSLVDLENFARAVELFPHMSSMLKVDEEPRRFIADRTVDAGIQNLLFADCRSVEDVKECVRVARPETPQDGGVHGCAMRRNVGYVLECGSEAWAEAQRDVVVAIMIEKIGAMEKLEEILGVKGVDMVQFGPCDYSISRGTPGQWSLPEVQRAERDMIELALKKGIQPRVELDNLEGARQYIDMGVRHFCIGTDFVTIYEWCKQSGDGMRKLLASV